MQPVIIGREEEIDILEKLLNSRQPELLAIYGRRRVGKTYLIKTFYSANMKFSCSGQLAGNMTEQLINFRQQLHLYFPKNKQLPTPSTWQQAFVQLRECLDLRKSPEKKVLFFDEFSWLDNHKSGFVSAFSYFWNMYASQRPDMLVVICGSAASWMIKKVINNKGGLHNRITQRLRLLPFTLGETRKYLAYRHIHLSDYQLLQLYMVMGGVPHYLNAVERGRSVQQNIDKICFSKDGALTNEFVNLYAALFTNYEKHIRVMQALSKKNSGLTRNELLLVAKLFTGGGLTTVLEELAESGFIEKINPYNKKSKESLFRLTDEFSLFYFRFMQRGKIKGKNEWPAVSRSAAYISWCGYAFESICLKHIYPVKIALGIAGVHSSQSSWYKTGTKQNDGCQVDLLIDRDDQCINIFEIKFSPVEYTIDKRYSELLKRKILAFKKDVPARKTVLFTFITTYGVANNEYKQQWVDNEITMEALFR
jgi:uncharacterized protein